jgi:hypothetical protein
MPLTDIDPHRRGESGAIAAIRCRISSQSVVLANVFAMTILHAQE